jgi:hypothetical protein
VNPLKILLFAANPFGDLNLDEEIRRIEGKLDEGDLRKIQLVPVLATRPGDLIDKLNRHRPKVVQFSGHGVRGSAIPTHGDHSNPSVSRKLDGGEAEAEWEGRIVLIGEDDKPHPVGEDALASLFQLHSDIVRIVVLNACFTESQAKAIAEHIDCVIGTTRSILDKAARILAARLYRSLAAGFSVSRALEEARIELKLQRLEEQAEIPRLWTRTGVDPSRVYLVPSKERALRGTQGGDSREPMRKPTPTQKQVPRIKRSAYKIDGLKTRRTSLIAKHQAATNQWITTLNAADKVSLQAQIDTLEQEIQEVEAELERLSAG